MSFLLEISINEEKPIVAGFLEGFHGVSMVVTALNHPVMGESVGINVGGQLYNGTENLRWLEQKLKAGDKIRIKVIENVPLSEPEAIIKLPVPDSNQQG
ncbi:hypothetical protein [Chitinophaga barathri]|uniref:Uncharacterized protein n=1 Tax=Chitinophaga barathri TaxID=1647451 RepID=A0A3N4M7Y3_9BACT|nr:hypothetical protein [Chitinophaga barathri]RPD39481.1 hypothetical protein EG028_20400 [Chitinophaga barathri]